MVIAERGREYMRHVESIGMLSHAAANAAAHVGRLAAASSVPVVGRAL
jgi:hypothetical protein